MKMTEERFEYNHMEGFKPYIYDVNDNHMVDDLEIICELLNQLSNEIEELKSKLNESKKAHSRCDKLWWELYDEKEQLEKEVEQLKKENQELRMSPRVDVNEIELLVCENEQLKAENEELREENKSWLKTASRMDTIHHEDREYCEKMHRENEKLKQENQQYKSILQDMGLLISGDDERAIRNNFADKIIKPIFAESGFDVDVDTSNGFAISLKEEKE